MGIAALVVWILTASGGAFMLAKWVNGGGHRSSTASRLPPAVVFGHFVLAAVGLVLWIIYVVTDDHTIGWIGLALLAPVVILGFVMVARWASGRRVNLPAGQPSSAGTDRSSALEAPERSFPVAVVVAHGVLAVATVVLALLALAEVGG
jgi:manganese efflux pump family protein